MRTRGCFKIAPDVVCEGSMPVRFDLRSSGRLLQVGGVWLLGDERDVFARSDGFADFGEMVGFWLKEHGPILFEGVCIQWQEVAADIGGE